MSGRNIKKLIIVGIFLFILAVAYSALNSSYLKEFVVSKVSAVLQEKFHINLEIDEISFFNFYGEMNLYGVRVKFRDSKIKDDKPDISVKRVSVSMGIFASIFQGVTVKKIYLESPEVRIIVKKGKLFNIVLPKEKKANKSEITETGEEVLSKRGSAFKFGIDNIEVDKFVVSGSIDGKEFIANTDINAELSSLKSGKIVLGVHELKLPGDETGLPLKTLSFSIDKAHKVVEVELAMSKSKVKVTGNIKNLMKPDELEFVGNAKLDIGSDLKMFEPGIGDKFSITGGALIRYKNKKIAVNKIELTGSDLTNSFFSADSLSFNGSFEKNTLNIDKCLVGLGDGQFLIKSKIKMDSKMSIEGDLVTKGSMTLGKIFKSLSINMKELDSAIAGKIPFKGELSPFRFEIYPSIDIPDLTYSLPENKKIIFAPTAIKGFAELTSEYVDFQPLTLGTDKPQKVQGKIVYSRGYEDLRILLNRFKLNDITLQGFEKISGGVDIASSLTGDYLRPTGAINFNINSLKYGVIRLPSIKGTVSVKGSEIKIEEATLNIQDNKISVEAEADEGKYKVAVFTKNFMLHSISELLGLTFLENIRGDLSVDLKANKTGDDVSIAGKVKGEKFLLMGEKINAFSIEISDGKKSKVKVLIKKGDGLIKIAGFKEDNKLDYKISSDKLNLKDINALPNVVSGALLINGTVSGTVKNPRVRSLMKLRGVVVRGNPVDSSELSVSFENNKLKINGNFIGEQGILEADWSEKKGFIGSLRLDNFSLNPILDMISRNYSEARGKVSGEFDFYNDTVVGMIEKFKVRKGQNNLYLSKPVHLTIDSKKIKLSPVKIKGEGLLLDITQKKNKSGKDIFDLKTMIDLGLFYPVIPDITHASGKLNYEGVVTYDHRRGVVENIVGKGRLRKVTLGLISITQVIENINGKISHDLNSFRVKDVAGEFGGGIFKIRGLLDYNNGISANLNISTEDVMFRYKDALQARVTSNLTLYGDKLPINLKGNVNIKRMLFSQKIDYKSEVKKALRKKKTYTVQNIANQSKFINLNIDIKGDELLINNNMAKAELKARLKVIGDNTKPIILGTVEAVDGHLLLKGRQFEISHLKVLFDNKETIDPIVALDTEADYKSHLVRMNVRGSPKTEIKVNFSSKPPLEKKRVLLLISTGSAEGSEQDLAMAEAADLLLPIESVTSLAEDLTGVDRIRAVPGSYQGTSSKSKKRGAVVLTAEKDLSDDMMLKFVSSEDFSAYRLNLDYYFSPTTRFEYGKESEDGVTSDSVDIIWEKTYK